MKKRLILLNYICVGMMCFFAASTALSSEQTDVGISIVKISPEDGTAVIRNEENGLIVIKVGDSIMKNKGEVVEIAQERIVIEIPDQNGMETVILNIKNGNQQINRIRKTPEAETVSYPIESKQIELK